MSDRRPRILVGQAGGPTAVINASLAGVVSAAVDPPGESGPLARVLGMRFGIEGFLQGEVVDLSAMGRGDIDRLRSTPGSALGSCRYKLQDSDLPRIAAELARHGVDGLIYIGGNDTMDTIHRISDYCASHSLPVTGVGVPKTVDNDLYATDHTPGYASAARYVALSVRQAARLARDMQRVDRFVVHQTIGRDAGWLAAAASLGRRQEAEGPHAIYLPEQRITPARVLEDVEEAVRRHGFAFLVVGEGTRWESGEPVSAGASSDAFSNTEYGAMSGASAAMSLHALISGELGLRGEFQVPESMPMSADDRRAPHDAAEAWDCGVEAVRRVVAGEGGSMVTLQRNPGADGAYGWALGTAPLSEVAVRARPMPEAMVAQSYVTDAFRDYAEPLVGPLPEYYDIARLAEGATS